MRRALLGTLVLLGCGEPLAPDCTSGVLGLRVYGRYDCADLTTHEETVLAVFSARLGWDYDTMHERMDEYTVRVRQDTVQPGMFRSDSRDLWVSGQTWCSGSMIHVADVPWKRGSLAHELAHVYQRCWARGTCAEGETSDHCGWTEGGIYAAIKETKE